MKKSVTVLSRRAESELDRIEAFIAVDNPEAAARIRKEILLQAIRLAENPEMGPEMGWSLNKPNPRHRTLAGYQISPVSNPLSR